MLVEIKLKSSRNMKDNNEITGAPYLVFFVDGSSGKDTKNGAAVTSLRSFLYHDNFRACFPKFAMDKSPFYDHF